MTDEDARRLAAIYSSDAGAYAEVWSPVIRPAAERLLEALPWGAVRRVLDLGTGTGALLPGLRRRAPAAWILGVDQAAGLLALARDRGAALALMDARQLALATGCIDVVVLAFVLFHFAEPVSVLREVGRVLQPRGVVGAVTWAEQPPYPAGRVWEEELDAQGAQDPTPAPRNDEAMNTPEKLAALLAAAGLEPVQAWIEPVEHQWDFETHLALNATHGKSKRRLAQLPGPTRAACLERVRARLARLGREDFRYRAAAVCAVGRRPLPPDA